MNQLFVFFILLIYSVFIHIKLNVNILFAPIIFLSFLSCLSLILGIFGILDVCVLVIEILSIFIIINLLFFGKNRKKVFSLFKNPKFILTSIFLIIYTIYQSTNSYLVHYDNFSHWALIVKNTYLTNRLANSNDNLVLFQSYPLGSSLIIWFVCKLTNLSDSTMIFGQQIIVFSSLLPIFVFSKNIKSFFTCVILSVFLLVTNITIYDLLVDTLLTTVSLSIVCFVIYYRDKELCIFTKLLIVSLMVCFLINIKNSGIFFAVVCVIFFFYNQRLSNFSKKELFFSLFSLVIIPLIFVIMWKHHITVSFIAGNYSKHSLNLKAYLNNFLAQDSTNIKNVSLAYISELTKTDTFEFYCLIFLLVISLIRYLSIKGHGARNLIKEFCCIFSIYFVYLIFLYVMYLVSMPYNEAIQLGGFDRYVATICCFVVGLEIIYLLNNNETTNSVFILACVLLTILLYPFKDNCKNLIKRRNFQDSIRYQVISLINEYDIKNNGIYKIYYHHPDPASYLRFLCVYSFWSNDVEVDDGQQTLSNLDWIPDYFDYIMILTPDDTSNEIVRSLYGDVKELYDKQHVLMFKH